MPSKLTRLFACMSALLFAYACSPRNPASSLRDFDPGKAPLKSQLVGNWKFQLAGMNWEWGFALDGSLKWAIVGQTDMGGKPVDIGGSGSYEFDGSALTMRFEKFAGIPGILRSAAAAPGFDPSTKVAVRFAGKEAMTWSFTTESYGAEEVEAARLR